MYSSRVTGMPLPTIQMGLGTLLLYGPSTGRFLNSSKEAGIDAKELAELCASVTTDMDTVKQGLLPKDATERLKRMEKLSKRMRDNLTRASTER